MVKKLKKSTKKFLKGGGLANKLAAQNANKYRRKKTPIELRTRAIRAQLDQKEAERAAINDEKFKLIPDEENFDQVLVRELQAIIGREAVGTEAMIAGLFNEDPLAITDGAELQQGDEQEEQEDEGGIDEDNGYSSSSSSEQPSQNPDEEEGVASHRAHLIELEKNDPEFFAHLKSNEPNLLEWNKDGEEEGAPVDSFEDEDEGEMITPQLVLGWRKALRGGGKGARRASNQLLDVWEWIARSHSSADNDEMDDEEANELRFTLSDDSVFMQLFSCSVVSLTSYWDTLLGRQSYIDKGEEGARAPLPPMCNKWRSVRHKARRWSLALSSILADAAREVEGPVHYTMVMLTTRLSVDYIIPFASALRKTLRGLLQIWTDPALPVSDNSGLRVAAFLTMREIALRGPHPTLERVCRAAYLAYASASSQVASTEPETVVWLRGTCVELLSLDPSQCYPILFVAIRQLALQMRLALQYSGKMSHPGASNRKSKKVAGRGKWFQRCYNWEFISCLELIVDVLCQFVSPYTPTKSQKESPLDPLLFPTVTVLQGMLDIHPVLIWAPLHLKCVEMLVSLSKASQRLLPGPAACTRIASAILTQGSSKDIPTQYQANQLRVRVLDNGTREGLMVESLRLIKGYAAILGADVAFPEWISPIVSVLKRSNKRCKIGKWRSASSALTELLLTNSVWVQQRRQELALSPQDLSKCWAFSKKELNNAPIVKHNLKLESVRMMVQEQKRKQSKGVEQNKKGKKKKKRHKNKRKSVELGSETRPLEFSDDSE